MHRTHRHRHRHKTHKMVNVRQSPTTSDTGKLQYIYYNTGDYSWIPHTDWLDLISSNYQILHGK